MGGPSIGPWIAIRWGNLKLYCVLLLTLWMRWIPDWSEELSAKRQDFVEQMGLATYLVRGYGGLQPIVSSPFSKVWASTPRTSPASFSPFFLAPPVDLSGGFDQFLPGHSYRSAAGLFDLSKPSKKFLGTFGWWSSHKFLSSTINICCCWTYSSSCFVGGGGLTSTRKLVGRNLTLVLELDLSKVSDLLLFSLCNLRVLVESSFLPTHWLV